MANQEHLNLLKQGMERWNEWRRPLGEWPDLSDAALRSDAFIPDLRKADLRGADLRYAKLFATDLTGAQLDNANLHRADLRDAFLDDATLTGVRLDNANLTGANLTGADLTGANLTGADLTGAKLSRATLHSATLSRATLTGADLSDANLIGADLRDAILSHAYLRDADLRGVYLNEATLSDADLTNADLTGATLLRATLLRATLRSANLSSALLRGADLSEVHLWKTIFAENDLSEVKGLVEIDHRGPSHVELHTVKLPQDGSALHFLRETGVSNEWIDFYRATMMMPIQYHSCFISYAHQDEMLARRLHADLQNNGIRCWFAPEDMKIGDKIRARIDEAIHLHEKLLLLLSEHSLASIWVEDEVEAALEKERRQQREVLFPVRLDENVMQTSTAWAKQLRRMRHIGDFTHWTDPQAYQLAFERLLRDLKQS